MARPSRTSVYQMVQDQVGELHRELGGLPAPTQAAEIWRTIWFEESHHSTAIEGNTLVLKQVELLLAEGRAVGNKELREYMEVRGYAAAADWVYREAHERRDRDELLTMTELRSIHTVAMTPVWDVAPHASATDREAPGSFREHDIARFPGGMTPPTWPLVASEISQWLRSVSMIDASTIEFPEQLASIHHKFETIHPFLDGNGRTGRLVLNLLLVRNGYPPVVILKSERSKYLSCLRRADKGDIGALGEFIARAILRSLVRFVVPSTADDATLVLIAALETKDLSVGALRIAAVRGRLRAVKGSDGRWRSTKRWVEQYVKSLHVRQSD